MWKKIFLGLILVVLIVFDLSVADMALTTYMNNGDGQAHAGNFVGTVILLAVLIVINNRVIGYMARMYVDDTDKK